MLEQSTLSGKQIWIFWTKINALDLNDPAWKIYTEDPTTPPHYIGPNADIKRSFITQGCMIDGEVKNLRVIYQCQDRYRRQSH